MELLIVAEYRDILNRRAFAQLVAIDFDFCFAVWIIEERLFALGVVVFALVGFSYAPWALDN